MHRTHVAIVDRDTARHLLAGRKRIESRFSRRRRPPLGRAHPGDTVHFKISGGQVIGTARITLVREFDQLSPGAMRRLRGRFNDAILAPARYWTARRHCHYGLLIWITTLVPPPAGLRVPRQYGNGWIVLTDMAQGPGAGIE